MNQRAKKKLPVNDDGEQPYSFSDEATKDKIKRHLKDIKDVITEDDIANVKVPGKDDVNSPGEKEKDTEVEDLESLPKKPVTPWDALEE